MRQSGAKPTNIRLVGRYRLTLRHGPRVHHESFDDLDAALAAMSRSADEIRREGPLDEISAIRDYEPGQRVHARLELSTGGLFRGREAGVDVMGDGGLVPYVGVVRKRRLEPERGQTAFDAIRGALS
jgi:hypothetical protein